MRTPFPPYAIPFLTLVKLIFDSCQKYFLQLSKYFLTTVKKGIALGIIVALVR